MKKLNIIFKLSFSLLLTMVVANNSLAQLVGWGNKEMISIQENSNTLKLDYQVLITLNTQALIAANQMQPNGEDIRFAKDCYGTSLYNYFIESGINTPSTKIWVMIDSLPANGSRIIHLFYGNATAVAASSFDNTFPPASRLVVPAGSVTLTGTNNYSWFEIQAGATVTVGPNSPFVINARMIRVAGTLNGNGAGFLGGTPGTNGSGPGAGQVSSGNTGTFGAGGGSYGGLGGNGGGAGATANPSNVGQPGAIYGTLNTDSIEMGSGGGGSASGGAGGAGGAGITLNGDVVNILATGIVSANGSNGVQAILNGAGGGGSGGGIKINGNSVVFNGILRANGGNGQPGGYGSGGGGGGRIKIFSDASLVNTGTVLVNGGAAGASNNETVPQTPGDTGTTFTGTYISSIPTFSFIPTPNVVLSTSTNPSCQGNPITFTATTGFSNYNFFVNESSIQDSIINTYSSASLNNNDTVKVLATYASTCIDTSNLIVVTVNSNDTINLTSSAGTNAQTVCINTAITDITYAITGGGTSANATGLPTGVTGVFVGGVFTISGTPTASGTHNYTVTTVGACVNAVETGSIIVNQPTTFTQTFNECQGFSITVGTNTYTTTGIFTDVLTGSNGCDSTVTTDLTINTVDNSTSTAANTITANAAGATYQWLDCDNGNAIIPSETSQSYTATANGNYAVEVTQNGCTDTSSCVNITGVGLEEYNSTEVSIYPNPTSDLIAVSLKNALTHEANFTLTTLEGKIIKQERVNNTTVVMDLSEQPKGVYLLKMENAQSVNVYKVIRQ